ncbi:MAG: STAS domain-containing protein [Acidimicrobiales bacterium]
MDSLQIAVTCTDDPVVRLEVDGEVDMATAPQLLDSLRCAAMLHERCYIVLDLRNLTFIDCVGVSAIIEGDQRAREAHAHLIVCNPPRMVQHLFEVTGLDDVLDVRPSWALSNLTSGADG